MKQIVYITSPNSKQLHVLEMNDNGSLTLNQVINMPGHGQPLAIHPSKKYLYVGTRPIYGIIQYLIDKNGLLFQQKVTSISCSPTHISITGNGKILYCSSYQNSCLSVSKIDKDGTVNEPFQVIYNLLNCHSANIEIVNNILFVCCLSEDCIRLFNINIDGRLEPCKCQLINIKKGSGPRHMVFHNSNNYAYIINEINGTISLINISKISTMEIKVVQTLNLIPINLFNTFWASDIHITPNGRFLYCSDRISNSIICFSVSQSGRNLYFLNYQLTEHQPRGFAIDTLGNYLVVAGQKSNSVSVYNINQDNGKLNLICRYIVGDGPVWVEIISI